MVSIDAAGDSFDLAKRKRRGEEDARRSRTAGDLADGEERLPGERIMRLDRRRPPVRHQEFAALAAGDGDAVRIGRGEQGADTLIRPASPATFSRGEKGALPLSLGERGWG